MTEVRQLLAGLSADPVPKLRPVSGRGKASRRGLPAFVRDQISVANAEHAEGTHAPEGTRRDFLYIATAAVGGVGIALTLWPFISQMNPDASVLALAAIDVDIEPIAEGQSITVNWRGNPVFIRHRTPAEIEAARAVPVEELPDPLARNANLEEAAPATDENRVIEGKEQYLVQVGVCTHLGCVPIGESGDFSGWFCPCHGSHYDTAGRIRSGPAPENLAIPPYEYLTDTQIRIG
jgi:ubiquinol-cytochrome c reductase iron-sulfur subunit